MSDNRLTDEQIAAWREIAKAAGPHEAWFFGATKEADPDDVTRAFREAYDKNPAGPVHVVHVPDKDADSGLYVAITGNGPTSAANAKFIAWCSPQNVIALLKDLEHTRDERDTAIRRLRSLADSPPEPEQTLTVADGLRDPRVRAGTHVIAWEPHLCREMQIRFHPPSGQWDARPADGEWTRVALFAFCDLDMPCRLIPAEGVKAEEGL